MADRIRGITIEIGGDTTKLSEALKGANKEIKDCQSALRDVNKLLKLDPGNVDLLKQKQGYLKNEIAATSTKLEEEKKALAQMKSASTTGEVSEEQKRLERDIIETEASLSSLKKEYKDFGSVGKQVLQNAGKNIKDVGSKITGVGTKLTAGLTGPIVGMGAAAMAAFSEVDAGLDIVIAKTGASGDALEDMQGIVKEIATSMPTDFETAGNAVGEVNTRFGLTGDALQDLSKKFIQFASINGTDVTSSVDQAQKALSAFGLSADSAGTLLDAMNATGQATGVSMDTLLSGLVSNGAAFQEMGLTIDQAVVAMGAMEVSGADSSAVMSGLQKALKNAAAEGIPFNEALANIQTAILTDTDGMGGLTAAYDLFGKSGAQIYAAVQAGTLDFAALGTTATEMGGSVTAAYEGMIDPADQATVAINAAKVAGAELGNTLQTAAAPILTTVTDLIKGLTEKFRSLTPEQQQTIIKAVALVAAIGPVISIVGGLVSGLGTLVAAFNPVTLVIGAIIAAGVALWKNWDTVKAAAQKLWSFIQPIFQRIGNFIGGIWSGLVQKTTQTWNSIKQAIQNPLETAKNFVKGAIDKIKGIFNFSWSLPKLKLPHVSISGGFSLFPPSIPHFSIDWYKKAYNEPVMFNQPTVVPTASGYKGFGDGNGSEVVIGMNKLQELVKQSSGDSYNVSFNITQLPNEDGEALARRVDAEFTRWFRQKEVTGFA